MKRVARASLRVGILLLLGLAVVDPHLPGAPFRRRVYLIDVSASVARTSGTDAFTPDDALRLATHDLASLRPGDQVALVAFGAKPAVLVPLAAVSEARFPVRIEGVDGSSSDLPAALEMARALAEEGEIILFSDGRSTAGRVPVEKFRVPVHTFPLGPLGGVDVSIRAIDAPSSAPPGASLQIRITVGSTGPWRGDLVAGVERHALEFTGPGLQDVVLSGTMPGDDHKVAVRVVAVDPCPENDGAVVTVWRETQSLRVLVVSPDRSLAAAFREPRWTATWAGDLSSAADADVIVLQRLRADEAAPADVDRLARLVRDGGAGVVMLGGPSAFALGGWAGTPLEDLLPYWAFPDDRSAVVFVLDRSGSMAEPAPGRSRPRIEEAVSAVLRSVQMMHDDDEVALVTFAEAAETRCPIVAGRDRGRAAAALQGIAAGGPTVLSKALDLAGATVKSAKAGRRRLVVVTDGQSIGEDDAVRSAARLLRADGIGVTIVRTGEASTPALAILRESGAEEIDGSDFSTLESRLAEAIARSRELTVAPSAGLAFAGLRGSPKPALLNRASLKPGAQPLARAGDLAVAAVRPAGRGQAAAATFSFDPGWAGELADWPDAPACVLRLAEAAAPPAAGLPAAVTARFEDDRLEIVAAMKGPERPATLEVTVDGTGVGLVRRGENTYAKSLRHKSDSAAVRIEGRIAAVARRSHAPEFDGVGPDSASLGALSEATGGRRLEAPRDLAALPGRGPSEPRSVRAWLLVAALVLFLLDVAAGLLPK